jgi:adenylate kinase
MLNIVLFGPPGAGKGTQSKKLCDKYNLIHLSTGDLLRDEISRTTQLGMQAKSLMDKGELVSDEVVIAMIGGKLDANPTAKGFIFDGFPRTQAQAKALDELLDKKKAPISMMVALEVNDEELLNRLLLRGADSGRADDRDENVIRRRIFNYNNQTAPLKKYYSEQKKFHSVYGMGSIDDIFELLVATIDNYYDGMVTVADISVDDEPAKHLKDVFETIKEKAKPVVSAIKKFFKKKAVTKPAKKSVPAKKKTAAKPTAAKKGKVVKKSPAKKKAVAKKKVAVKKSKPVVKKATKKVAAKKIIKKVIAKKSKARVVKKSPAKKKVAAKKIIKKSSKKKSRA